MNQQQIYDTLIAEFKTPKHLAELLNLSVWSIYSWRRRKIPQKHLYDIAYFSQQKFQKSFLRPDKFNYVNN